MANPIGDFAFPDNAKRRKRAGELHDDIVAFGAAFQKLHNERAQMVARLKPKVDALLHKFQIATPEQLEKKINASLNSEQILQYRDLKSKLDKSDSFMSLLSGLVDLGAAVTGVVLVGLAIAGIVTGGAAFAAAGEIIAILGAIVAIVGLFEGAEEREALRKAIQDLWPKRRQVRMALGQMEVVTSWIKTIEIWVDSLSASASDSVDILVNSTVKQDYMQWSEGYTDHVLLQLDESRGSWMNEDPGHDIIPDTGSILPIINPFKPMGGLLGLIGSL